MDEQHRVGLESLAAATTLLQRVRRQHPSAGLLEAADLQWWWREPRSTDAMPQLFWFDAVGQPAAAVLATDWGDAVALDPIVLPGASPEWAAHVVSRGLAHASACGLDAVEVVVDPTDLALRQHLLAHGLTELTGDDAAESDSLSVVSSSLEARARPAVSPLADGYTVRSRLDTLHRPHHLIARNGQEVEARLRQTSLYRPDLDLLVLDRDDEVAAYALFWLDPHSATGLVEPMRTEDAHQRRGLARHLLTAGVDRLAGAGAERTKICFEPDNPASSSLYLDVGFQPDKQSQSFRRLAGAGPAAR
jgi:GNAT superfamily N-acetyltransferase